MIKITVYGTKTCPFCVKLKEWLDDESIEHTYYDVAENPIAAINLERINTAGVVPFSTIETADGKIENVVGFDKDKFNSAIKADK
jgi:glutaredoxin